MTTRDHDVETEYGLATLAVTGCDGPGCDQTTMDLSRTIGWYSLDQEGVVTTTYSEPVWELHHYCSLTCLGAWVGERDQGWAKVYQFPYGRS